MSPAPKIIVPISSIKFMRLLSNVPVLAMVEAPKTACSGPVFAPSTDWVGVEELPPHGCDPQPSPSLRPSPPPELVDVCVEVGVGVAVGVTHALFAQGSIVGVGVTVGVGVIVAAYWQTELSAICVVGSISLS